MSSSGPLTEIVRLSALQDNYIYMVCPSDSDEIIVIDPSEADPVVEECSRRQRRLSLILNTHHHNDHTGANTALQQIFGCPVGGSAADATRLPGLSLGLAGGMTVPLASRLVMQVLEVPGHTTGHLAYVLPEVPAVFCGDTLFASGCGRMFEGTPAQFWSSLLALRALPDETLVCCAHEYTESNARFALSLEPESPVLAARLAEVTALRQAGTPTVPVRLGGEKACNPFLRADDPILQKALGLEGQSGEAVFAWLRRQKDVYRPV